MTSSWSVRFVGAFLEISEVLVQHLSHIFLKAWTMLVWMNEHHLADSTFCSNALIAAVVRWSPVLMAFITRPMHTTPITVASPLGLCVCLSLPTSPHTSQNDPWWGQHQIAAQTICVGRPQNAEAITWPILVKLKAGARNSSSNS